MNNPNRTRGETSRISVASPWAARRCPRTSSRVSRVVVVACRADCSPRLSCTGTINTRLRAPSSACRPLLADSWPQWHHCRRSSARGQFRLLLFFRPWCPISSPDARRRGLIQSWTTCAFLRDAPSTGRFLRWGGSMFRPSSLGMLQHPHLPCKGYWQHPCTWIRGRLEQVFCCRCPSF